MSSNYIVKAKQDIPGNVLSLTLAPETTKDKIDHDAGQYVTVGFKRRGRKTPVRSFSIVSDPRSDELQVAMRTQGNFTSAMRDVQVGDIVYVQGPFGEFVVNPSYDRTIVMLAGGIGITPFISMLRYVTSTNMPVSVTLLYSCRSLSEAPFYDEILQLQRRNPNLRVVFFVTNGQGESAEGATVVHSTISEEHLQKVTGGNFAGITYFACGPKGFMNTMERTLMKNGVRGDRIVTESFAQSSKLFSGQGWTPQSITYALSAGLVVAGAAGIMLLDLIRAVPKLASANSATTSTSTTTETPDTAATTSPTTSTTTTPTTTPAPTTTVTPTYTYQQPVSRQS